MRKLTGEVKDSGVRVHSYWYPCFACNAKVYKDLEGLIHNLFDGTKHNCHCYRGGVYISREQEKTMGDPELRPTPNIGVTDFLVGQKVDMVNHPPHYTKGKIEVIDFIEDQNLGYHLSSVIKYVCRSPHKGSQIQDLEKARWYLDREIARLKNGA